MSVGYSNESMLDMFIFETTQQIEQLEQSILDNEKTSSYTQTAINEIFRIMHTIKGSSAMMMFENISSLSHSIEDLFYFLREEKPEKVDYSALSDLILEGVDFIKVEIVKIRNGDNADGEAFALVEKIKTFLVVLKQSNGSSAITQVKEYTDIKEQQFYISPVKVKASIPKNAFKAVIRFEAGCEMENIRAYSIIHNLKDLSDELAYVPEEIIDNDESLDIIRRDGFKVFLKSDRSYEDIHEFFMQTVFLKDLELIQMESDEDLRQFPEAKQEAPKQLSKTPLLSTQVKEDKWEDNKDIQTTATQQSLISVNVNKLDRLMDLVGEMVIAEAMVTQNPDLKGLELHNFQKAARQLKKITNELQDMVMAVRMLPISATFNRMQRIVRDMSKRLNKEVQLELIGEETEVDKNIIEHISDPLMHLIRNSIDHGMETAEERLMKGKTPSGKITLKAQNAGSDVVITVKDDGKGLNRGKILERAKEHGLIYKPEDEMSDKEIYSLIFLPGFSTKDNISEFSGRGVGMDVVVKNIETVGGSVSVESVTDAGTTVYLKIPLTLAIIDGMNIRVGKAMYTIPTISIKESFRASEKNIIIDPDSNEMIMVRGQCYPILRLHERFKVKTAVTNIPEGIIVMVENGDDSICIFADELVGEQQVVVKTLPSYIRNIRKIRGLAGCTLLGDGSISLILDAASLVEPQMQNISNNISNKERR